MKYIRKEGTNTIIINRERERQYNERTSTRYYNKAKLKESKKKKRIASNGLCVFVCIILAFYKITQEFLYLMLS